MMESGWLDQNFSADERLPTARIDEVLLQQAPPDEPDERVRSGAAG